MATESDAGDSLSGPGCSVIGRRIHAIEPDALAWLTEHAASRPMAARTAGAAARRAFIGTPFVSADAECAGHGLYGVWRAQAVPGPGSLVGHALWAPIEQRLLISAGSVAHLPGTGGTAFPFGSMAGD